MCRNDIPNLDDDTPIINCSKCNGDLCNKCADNHKLRKPNHKITLIKYVLPKINKKDNCNICGTDIKNLNKCKNCDDCNLLLCDECGNNHQLKCPNHKIRVIKRKVPKKRVNDSNCLICDKNIPIDKDNINYCINCEGNICDDCNKGHNDKYPSHISKTVKTIKINPEKESKDSLLLKCKRCTKNLDENKPITYCYTCSGNLCDECGNEHYKNKLNHVLSLIKYIKPKDDSNCNGCGNDLKDNYINCDECNIPLCDKCGDNHKEKNPNHKLRVVKRKVPIKKEEEDKEDIKDEEYPKLNCAVCDKNIPVKNNNYINYCNDCDGNLCNNCNNEHNNKYPDHAKNIARLYKVPVEESINVPVIKCDECNKNLDDKQPIQYCPECKENLCDRCDDVHDRNKPDHKITLIRYLKPNDDSNCNECGNDLNDNYEKCDKCNIPLCDECGDEHKEKKPNHKIRVVKRKVPRRVEEDEDSQRYPKINCLECDKNIPIKNNDFINYCKECDGELCSNCNNNHKYPNHVSKIVKIIQINPEEEGKDIPLFKCRQCSKNLDENKPVQYCYTSNGNLCDKCGNDHYKNKLDHILSSIKYMKPNNDSNCNECGNDLKDDYKNCDKCYIPLCDRCGDNH